MLRRSVFQFHKSLRFLLFPLIGFTLILSITVTLALGDEGRLTLEQVKLILKTSKDLSGKNLSNLDLQGADLTEANLKGANLTKANLNQAKCYEADFRGATLSQANLSGANLEEADFRGANLT